jgi:hypothetical protein
MSVTSEIIKSIKIIFMELTFFGSIKYTRQFEEGFNTVKRFQNHLARERACDLPGQ